MNKYIIFFIVLLFTITLLLISYFYYFSYQPCQSSERPVNVPISSVWIGGCDDGNWIELVENNSIYYRFRIYRDWDGELELDAKFKLASCCASMDINNLTINKIIAYYDISFVEDKKSILILKTSAHNNSNCNCYLELILPAYNGSDLEIINKNLTGHKVNHGNIQQRADDKNIIQPLVNTLINNN